MSDHKTWLSILLPAYNVEPYLIECVQSIVQQTGCDRGIEIIIVDDCSTDNSRSLAERLCAEIPQQLRLVCHDHNQGVSAARNRLLDEAKGEFIWFVDPDDYLLEGVINALKAIVARHNPDLILCDYRKSRFWKRKSFFGMEKLLSSDIPKLVRGVFKSRKMYCWVKISRRSLWQNGLRFPVGRVFEDVATIPWLLLRTRSFYYTPTPWVHYRQRQGSIMDSVRRQPEVFDEAKHDNLAQALCGYKEALADYFAMRDASVDYYVSDFCAREFTKTASRLMRAEHSRKGVEMTLPTLAKLQSLWEACSPVSFERLSLHYLKRLRFIRYAQLRYVLHYVESIRTKKPVCNCKVEPQSL